MSLCPLHALGMRSTRDKRKRKKKTVKARRQKRDFLVFDQDEDGPHWQAMLSQSLKKATPIIKQCRINIPLSAAIDQKVHPQELFADINPTDHDPTPGWMGHLATKSDDSSIANCVAVPLIGAAPLCALVATDDLEKGTKLFSLSPELLPPEISQQHSGRVQTKRRKEIEELASHLGMAHQPPLQPCVPTKKGNKDKEASDFKSHFHSIDMGYPGVRCVHEDPDIVAIDDFLTAERNVIESHKMPSPM